MTLKEIIENMKNKIKFCKNDSKGQNRKICNITINFLQSILPDLEEVNELQEEMIKEIKQLKQDNFDMKDSRQTSFSRCKKCGRISDSNYCCFYCGCDNSDE